MEVTLIVKYEGQEEVGHAKNAPKPRTRALQTEDAADAKASGGIPGWLEHDRREGETRDAISEVGRGRSWRAFQGKEFAFCYNVTSNHWRVSSRGMK